MEDSQWVNIGFDYNPVENFWKAIIMKWILDDKERKKKALKIIIKHHVKIWKMNFLSLKIQSYQYKMGYQLYVSVHKGNQRESS